MYKMVPPYDSFMDLQSMQRARKREDNQMTLETKVVAGAWRECEISYEL